MSPTAGAWASGLGGAGQTLGRIFYLSLARHTGVTIRAFVLIALGATTTAAFAAVPGPFPLLVMIAIAAGMVRGNLAVLQGIPAGPVSCFSMATDRVTRAVCATHEAPVPLGEVFEV